MTGLSLDTLRAWERRYQAVTPERGDRGRIYDDRHVERLKLLAALVENGHAIGSIAGKSDAALRRLQSGGDAPAGEPAALIDVDPLFRAVKQYDLDAIDAHMNRQAALLPPAELIFGVVLPVLREAGRRWEAGTISPAQEHLVSAIIRSVLGGVLRTLPRASGAARLVFATPAGERHELGLLCGAVLAASAGYAATYLGPDLPASLIAQAAQKAEASAVILTGTTAETDYRELRAINRLPEPIAIWTGGRRSADLQAAIGPRAQVVASLEDLRGLLNRHAA